ncbi:hypothetical protein [Escherichia coli]|uniref:hypothetical protein n=1 Tax=Escherichia coli TaxID=562 RepID=UPI0020212AEA|nr:hypothetical protein [Escherichia coli]
MKFKHYMEWKIPEAATKAAPGNFSGVYFLYGWQMVFRQQAGSLLSRNMQASRMGY